MIFNKQFNKSSSEYKNSAFLIKMDSPCKGFIKANNKLYVVCENSINLLETGIEKDPENKYPFAPNTNQKFLNKGINNYIIKRIYTYIDAIESNNFETYQCFTLASGIDKERMKTILFELLINLSTFEDSLIEFQNSYNKQLNNIALPRQDNNFELEAFIPNLDKKVRDIIITEIGGILNKLTNFVIETYGVNLSKNMRQKIMNNDKRLDNAFKIFQEQNIISIDSCSMQFIQEQNTDFLSYLIDIRNALEHRSIDKYVNIINFKLGPDRKYIPPKWEIYMHNRSQTSDLGQDLQNYSQKILNFTFNLLKIVIIENIKSYLFFEKGSICKYFKA